MKMKTVWRFGSLVLVALQMGAILLAQQAPSEIHRFAFFARGYSPAPLSNEPVRGVEGATVHIGYHSLFTVTNFSGEAVEVRLRFFSAGGDEIEIPLEIVQDGLANRSGNPALAPVSPGLGVSLGTLPILPTPVPADNPFRLESGSSLQVVTSLPSEPGITAGSLQVESSVPVGVSQALTTSFVLARGDLAVPLQLSVTQLDASAGVRGFSVFLRDNPLFAAGLALRAATLDEGETASGTLRLISPEGNELSQAEVTLTGRQGLMRPLREIFPELPLFVEGRLVGEFDSEVLVASVAFFKRVGQVYTVNPIIRIDP